MWIVPKIWKGGRCFVIGGGFSFIKQLGVPDDLYAKIINHQVPITAIRPYCEFLKEEYVIGINMAYKLGADLIDILFFGDTSFWEVNKMPMLNHFKSLRVTCGPSLEGVTTRVKILKKDHMHPYGISTKPGYISWNLNSGAAAINLAVLTGATQIILLGFDMNSQSPTQHHWHTEYGPRTLVKQQGVYVKHLQGFKTIAADAKKLGVEIINANPESAIKDFVKVNLKEIIHESK